MRRVSVTGWVPVKETETKTLDHCILNPKLLRENILWALRWTKVDALGAWPEGVKKLRVTVEIDVETLTK